MKKELPGRIIRRFKKHILRVPSSMFIYIHCSRGVPRIFFKGGFCFRVDLGVRVVSPVDADKDLIL